jgi:hypothetical protein
MINRKTVPSNDIYEEREVNGILIKLGMEVYHARVIPQTEYVMSKH